MIGKLSFEVNANDEDVISLSLSRRPLLRAVQVDMILSDEAGVGKPAEEGLKGDEEEEEVQHVLLVVVVIVAAVSAHMPSSGVTVNQLPDDCISKKARPFSQVKRCCVCKTA